MKWDEPVRSMLTNVRNPVAWAWWLSLLINCLLFAWHGAWPELPVDYGDAWSYLDAADSLAIGRPGAWRTPLYPIMLGLVGRWWGCVRQIEQIVCLIVQAVVFMIALIYLARVARSLGVSRMVAALLVLMMGAYPPVAFYNVIALPESLCISIGVFFAYSSVKHFRNPSIKSGLTICGWILVLILLKPIFIVLIPLALLLFIITLRRRLVSMACCVGALVLIGVSVECYRMWMWHTYGIRQLSYANVVNNYAFVREAGIFDVSDIDDPKLLRICEQLGPYKPHDEWRIYGLVVKEDLVPALDRVVTRCIMRQPEAVVKGILKRAEKVNQDKIYCWEDRFSYENIPLLRVWMLPIVVACVLLCLPFMHRRGWRVGFWLFASVIVLAIVATAWAGAMDGWGRLVIPAWGWWLLCVGCLVEFVRTQVIFIFQNYEL